MIKKILASALALATVYGASPAMAIMPMPPKKTVIVANITLASVNTTSVSDANTGGNSISFNCGPAAILTNKATAFSDVSTGVGVNDTTITDPCPCPTPVPGPCMCMQPMTPSSTTVVINGTAARVNTTSVASANTGNNSIAFNAGPAAIATNEAYAQSSVVIVVGSNVTKIK